MPAPLHVIELILSPNLVLYWDGTPGGFCTNPNHAKTYTSAALANAAIAATFPATSGWGVVAAAQIL